MNTYYTAKDIERLAAAGLRQLELDPTAVLTDFARETAQQLGIELVRKGWQSSPSAQPTTTNVPTQFSSKYNKPSGCQHAAGSVSAAQTRAASSAQALDGSSESTVNRLIDLMGKVIKRGD
jgi:Tfp pilus assembly protein PilV